MGRSIRFLSVSRLAAHLRLLLLWGLRLRRRLLWSRLLRLRLTLSGGLLLTGLANR